MVEIACGVYPTMITPYNKENEIDFEAVEKIVDWYADNKCDGVFAVCQSSEMNYLSLKERILLAEKTVKCAKKVSNVMNVVASGHVSGEIEAQAEEISAISETGIDAFVLVSNRLDLHNDGDCVWIKNAEKLLSKIPKDIDLGIYECPMPYKRLLSKELLGWCIETKRFRFIKDTCCDPIILDNRLKQLKTSGIKLFNANAQTLLYSLKKGAAGYSGIMANFHPDLYVWLCKKFNDEAERAETVQELLTMYAFEEAMHYPVTAKYHMVLEGIGMELDSRSCDKKGFSEYEKQVVKQGFNFERKIREWMSN